jgi:glycosyltransferase involved in cell wall biosynthesis
MAEPIRLRAPAPVAGVRPGPRPRVSVLIPAYNAAATIAEALESALVQSPPPHEVVVSDDGSRDNLAAALRPFRHHIRVVHGPNGGLAAARNRAAAAATGELFALLDADDVWRPGRVEAFMTAAAVRPDLAVLTTDAVESRGGAFSSGTYYSIRDFPVDGQELAILRSNFIFGAGAVRAEVFRAVGGYRAGARYAEDWDLWIRLVLMGHRAGLIEQPLYEYRRRGESLTGQKVELALGVLDVLAHARPLLVSSEQRQRMQLTEQEWREVAARAARKTADPRARRLAIRAAAGARSTPRARIRFAAAALLPRRATAAEAGNQ